MEDDARERRRSQARSSSAPARRARLKRLAGVLVVSVVLWSAASLAAAAPPDPLDSPGPQDRQDRQDRQGCRVPRSPGPSGPQDHLDPPAQPAPEVRFTRSGFKASALNGEWVVLQNLGDAPAAMGGWTLSSREDTYTFRGFTLQPGARVTMHSGGGTDTSRQLYLNAHHFIWGNRHDVGRLRDTDGLIVDRCNYRREAGESLFIC